MEYDAFISYSHAADGKLAPALQAGLQAFAKPWNRLRAIHLFRDKTGLAANPGLWSAVAEALESSEYFLLLASPGAAQSHWVDKEVHYWLTHRPAIHILIILTDGDIVWDSTANDFNWTATTALPEAFRRSFSEEPLWVDLRWAKSEDHVSLQNPGFRDVVADLSSAVRGIPKDQLIGEDVRQYRKSVLFRRSVFAGLGALATALLVATFVAFGQRNLAKRNEAEATRNAKDAITQRNEAVSARNVAEQRRRTALGRQLAAQAAYQFRLGAPSLLEVDALLFIEAMRRAPSFENDQELRTVLALLPRTVWSVLHDDSVTSVAFSRDGQFVATGCRDKSARVFEAVSGKMIARLRQGGIVWSVTFSGNGSSLATASADGTVRVYDVRSWNEVALLKPGLAPTKVAFSGDGRRLAVLIAGYIIAYEYQSGTWQTLGLPEVNGSSILSPAALGVSPSNRRDSHFASCCAPTTSVAALGDGGAASRGGSSRKRESTFPFTHRGDTA